MVDNLTVKYHQRSKETVDKKVTKSMKKFLIKKRKKGGYMVMKDIKTSLQMKNKS